MQPKWLVLVVKMINETLALTAYQIVRSQLNLQKDAEHKFFRIKNFTEDEIVSFVKFWREINDFGDVRLIVAENIKNQLPREFVAEEKKSITYYRNNNLNGLVYIETKIQSDEQGLQNIFTLHDSNFLDGSFNIDSENEKFIVSEAIVINAWSLIGKNAKLSDLLKSRVLEVLNAIEQFERVSLRNYAKFVVNLLTKYSLIGVAISDEAVNELIGNHLIYLDCFPDAHWRSDEKKTRRRLQLNRSYADLVSGSSDIDPDLLSNKINVFNFKDYNKVDFEKSINQKYRDACLDFLKIQNSRTRECIPYFIFEQLFLADVSGLRLGERVFNEIQASDSSRIEELSELNVVEGLNRKMEEDAKRFLEYEPPENLQKLQNLLTVTTRRLVEQLANPKAQQFFNPMLELVEVVGSLKEIYELDESYTLEICHGRRGIENNQSLRLFNFLFGKSLISASSKSKDNSFGVVLKVDPQLVDSIEPIQFKDVDDSLDEEAEDIDLLWSPIPIVFNLLDADGQVLHSVTKKEWYPTSDDLNYFAFFWLLLCASESQFVNIRNGIYIAADGSINQLLSDFANRVLPLDFVRGLSADKEPAIEDLLILRQGFLEKVRADGIDLEFINEYIDQWQPLFSATRSRLVPNGTRISAVSRLLDLDFLCLSSQKKIMLPTHPIRLRWIAKYLASCENLLVSVLSGDTELSKVNPTFYLDWLRSVSPSQCPAIASSLHGDILFSSGDQAWFEEFLPKSSDITGAILDSDSTKKISRQISSYLEAHPYKRDGLSILLVVPHTNKFPADLVASIKNGEWKGVCIHITVIAHKSKWHEISSYFDTLHDENRMVNDDRFFPLYDLSFIEYGENFSIEDSFDGEKFDIAVITHLLNEDVTPQNITEAPNHANGSFDPLIDRPTQLSGGIKGGAISILMKPDESDEMLETWSTHVIRSTRLSPVAPSQPENTDFLELRVNFDSSAKIFVELHRLCHWVITLERHISRQQIESLESSPDILSIEEGVGSNNNFTLIVSANSGKELIVSRIARKLQRLLLEYDVLKRFEVNANDLASEIYSQTRKFAPRLALKAMGVSRVTEEIIGLMVARSLAKLKVPQINYDGQKWVYASVSLDEHQNWFGGSSEIRADICNFSFILKKNLLTVDVEVIEGKLRQVYDVHGVFQAKSTCEFFEDILTHKDRVDAKLWRDQIISAIETADSKAISVHGFNQTSFSGVVPPEIREKFREGEYSVGAIKGIYSICITDSQRKSLSSEMQSGVEVIRSTSADIVPLILNRDLSSPVLGPSVGNENLIKDSAEVFTPAQIIEPVFTSIISPEDVSEVKHKAGENIISSLEKHNLSAAQLKDMYQSILDCFADQGVDVDPVPISELPYIEGPASILFKVSPRGTTDPKKLKDKSQVLKLRLKLGQEQEIMFSIDKGYVNIDVPKLSEQRYFVFAQDIWRTWKRPENSLVAPLGEDRFGQLVVVDFSNSLSPHLLVGGTTGSGKSEALNMLLYGLVNFYSSKELRLLLVDPKGTELQGFTKTPHLEGVISWDDVDALDLLKKAVIEMQSRYEKLREKGYRSIAEFNANAIEAEKMPWWLVVLDEYADLTSDPSMKKEIEAELKRLAQKARASGIHVIIATQKPSAEVISTNLRANLPAQLALRVKSATESRVIMDDSGAEMLNGKGDSYLKSGGITVRVQCGLVSNEVSEQVLSKFRV